MRYNCDDIEKFLAVSCERGIDQAAFIAHIESCPSCGQLVNLDLEGEKALGSLLPVPAPESISRNVMKAIRVEAKTEQAVSTINRIGYFFLSAVYLCVALVTVLNYKVIFSAIISTVNSLDSIKENSDIFRALKEPLLSCSAKLTESPLLLVALLGITLIIWTFSILRFREITK